MPIKIITLVFLLFSLSISNAQQSSDLQTKVNWLTIEEAMVKYKQVPKPILVDFYTDWCGWCKRMDKTTYSDDNTSSYINNYFYPVKFNAEGKDTITYLGKTYKPTSEAPKTPHEFALELMQGQMSYPTTIFLNGFDESKNAFALNMRAPGYLDVPKIEPLLIFSVENVFRNSNYQDFEVNFKTAFTDSTVNEKVERINWIAPVDAFTENSTNKKKTIVLIHTNWCNSCTVMQRASFTDNEVMSYIDSTYRIVKFNPEITDTLFLDGNRFVNEQQPQFPFHQLAISLTRKNLIIPTMALLDEENKLLDAIPFYLPPALLNKVLHYYGEGIYKNKTWMEFATQNP